MAGIVTYEIASPADRAFELSKFVASSSGAKQEALLQPVSSSQDFAGFVSGIVASLESVARSSSDDGGWCILRG